MRAGGETSRRRASAFEVVGAWLGVWTPPRDVDVPPVPVRKLAIGGALGLAVLALAVALIAPRIDASKQRTSARERAEQAARHAAERRRLIAEQRPRRGEAVALRPAATATHEERRAARAALLHRVEAAIGRDARARAAAGELRGRPGATSCAPYPPRPAGQRPEEDLTRRTGTYECLVLVRAIAATETNGPGGLGYPFRAVIDFARFRFAWCKTNPVPGERVVPDPRLVVELPAACRAPA